MTTMLIQPNFLSAKEDLELLIKGVRKCLEIIRQPAFEPYLERIVAPIDESDEALAEHIKNSLETIYHPVGTCKMGKDDAAVVNPKLQVHGIENLRVIDASIMPRIVAGNTNAPTIMIAEKGADMILNG